MAGFWPSSPGVQDSAGLRVIMVAEPRGPGDDEFPMDFSHLAGGPGPPRPEKYEFVNWDDECNPILVGK